MKIPTRHAFKLITGEPMFAQWLSAIRAGNDVEAADIESQFQERYLDMPSLSDLYERYWQEYQQRYPVIAKAVESNWQRD